MSLEFERVAQAIEAANNGRPLAPMPGSPEAIAHQAVETVEARSTAEGRTPDKDVADMTPAERATALAEAIREVHEDAEAERQRQARTAALSDPIELPPRHDDPWEDKRLRFTGRGAHVNRQAASSRTVHRLDPTADDQIRGYLERDLGADTTVW
ncbi:hypothetical protein GS534_13255 [Rhodococcus hoagii]|nr:hypothetical protein [Prescottella equi]